MRVAGQERKSFIQLWLCFHLGNNYLRKTKKVKSSAAKKSIFFYRRNVIFARRHIKQSFHLARLTYNLWDDSKTLEFNALRPPASIAPCSFPSFDFVKGCHPTTATRQVSPDVAGLVSFLMPVYALGAFYSHAGCYNAINSSPQSGLFSTIQPTLLGENLILYQCHKFYKGYF